jgi:flagellar hook protein FlgE
MIRSLNTGISALQQFQGSIDVIGNNIANVNTVGYKSSRTDFADTFYQTLRSSSVGTQVGSGVTTSGVQGLFGQGALNNTGLSTDMGISGEGFFMVKDAASSATYATRAGDFHLDSSGYLVTNSGMRVQGYSDSALKTEGDVKIDNTKDGTTPQAFDDPPANTKASSVVGFSVSEDGKIMVNLSDGSTFARGQVLLQTFTNPNALTREGNNLFSVTAQAGALAKAVAPGSSGAGKIQGSSLEASNVDLTSEFGNLITSQRAFQAGARIVTTSDEVLQEVINLKR